MSLYTPAAVDGAYRAFMVRANRKLYPSIPAMRNMQRVIGLVDPRGLGIKLEDLAHDQVVRRLDESGTVGRLYKSYGVSQ